MAISSNKQGVMLAAVGALLSLKNKGWPQESGQKCN